MSCCCSIVAELSVGRRSCRSLPHSAFVRVRVKGRANVVYGARANEAEQRGAPLVLTEVRAVSSSPVRRSPYLCPLVSRHSSAVVVFPRVVVCWCPADPQDPDATSGVVLTQDNVDVVVQVNTTVPAEVQMTLQEELFSAILCVLSFILLFRCNIDDRVVPRLRRSRDSGQTMLELARRDSQTTNAYTRAVTA